jgi:ketosteroid isomerase-like protein
MNGSIFFSRTFFIVISILLLSCNYTKVEKEESLTEENKLLQHEEVKNTLVKMWKAIENEDINEYAKYVHPSFTQFGEYDSILREGKQAEINGIQGWVDESDNIHTVMIDPKVTINGNTAWLTYYWSDNGTTNGVPFTSKGKSTRIFIRENGQWLCIHGHYTLLP